jgi:hypothetical protein
MTASAELGVAASTAELAEPAAPRPAVFATEGLFFAPFPSEQPAELAMKLTTDNAHQRRDRGFIVAQ